MASRYDRDYSPRPGYYDRGYLHPSRSSYTLRSHGRTQSERSNSARASSHHGRGKPRSNTLSAFVEDESIALAREHNPDRSHGLAAAADDINFPGEIDQVPILIEIEENPERRFVLIPGAAEPPQVTSGKQLPKVPSNLQEASTSNPDTSSVNTSTISGATPSSSASTPVSSADGAASTHARPAANDNHTGYEANTCRKFVVVPRTDTESVTSEPSTIASEADYSPQQRRRTQRTESESRRDKDSGKLGVAAAIAAAAATGATLAGSSKVEPEIKRRKSRVDLPRLDTEVDQPDTQNASSYTGRPYDRARSERNSRDRFGDRSDRRDNDFLSPTFTKHSTNGRDRAYFDQSTASASATTGPHRTRSRDAHSSLDDGRSHGHGRASFSADPDHKRRANSFSDNDKSKTSGYRRPSRDETTSSHKDRESPSPVPQKPRSPPSPHPRADKRPSSSAGARDRDLEREKEREREREEARQWERKREKDAERDTERELEKERLRRGVDTDRDRQRPARRDSAHRRRRDSVAREDDVYSSDERAKINATANAPIRRRNSERRRPTNPDIESVVGKISSNPDPSRPSGGSSDTSTNGRLKPAGTTPLATQFPFISGSSPKPLYEPRPPSPTKSYREERRGKDERRAESPSSPSSSPESRSRLQEGDRPRGPRPRAHTPNVVHNPASIASSLPNLPPPLTNLPPPAAQPRTPSFPVPIPTTLPIPMPPRGPVSKREEGEGWHERRRSPVETPRGYSSFAGNTARAPGGSVPPPSTSQTYTYRQKPDYYINTVGATVPDDSHDRPPELPAKGSDSGRADLPLVSIYLKYAEDVYQGRVKGLPECPRQMFSTRYRDWRTLSPFVDFYVCPKCYEAAFAHTRYADEFIPAPPVDPSEKTRCTFGSMYWYRVAFFFIESHKKSNLNLLRVMFDKDETLRLPCSGPNRVMGRWFTVQDPITARAVTRFSTCEQCATAIQILFPRLKGLFQDNDLSRFDTTNICALYYEQDRKRLWKYIDVFETTHNEAVSSGRPVDVNDFVNKLLDIGYYDECRRDIPVRGRKWYWMRSLPDFVVCQECFQDAVYPQVNSYRSVAGDFFKEPKELPLGACHLYSPRMRDIFTRACRNGDKEYLLKKLNERDEIATDITNRIHRLPPTVTPLDLEHRVLIAEWRKWE